MRVAANAGSMWCKQFTARLVVRWDALSSWSVHKPCGRPAGPLCGPVGHVIIDDGVLAPSRARPRLTACALVGYARRCEHAGRAADGRRVPWWRRAIAGAAPTRAQDTSAALARATLASEPPCGVAACA